MSPDDRDPSRKREAEDAAEVTLERLSLLADALEPLAPPAAVKARLLAQLEGPERWTPHARWVAAGFELPMADVTEALRRISDPGAWRAGPYPGSRQLVAEQLAAAHTLIIELPSTFHIPRHRHQARELTYVLDGEFLENGKQRHRSGAMLELLRGTEHEVAVSGQGPCLVVFGLRF